MNGTVDIDFETINTNRVSVVDVGSMRYASDPTTGWLCVAFSVDGGPIQGILRDQDRSAFERAVRSGRILKAYNAGFERNILWHVLGIQTPADQWFDIAWKAAYYSLPRSLEKAAIAANLKVEKDAAGARLMRRMCVGDGITPTTMARLLEYCKKDVEVEMALDRALPDLPAFHVRHGQMDLRMQARGIPFDRESTAALSRVVTWEAEASAKEFVALVGNTPKASVHFRKWLNDRGVAVADVAAGTLDLIDPAAVASPEARRALEIRKTAGLSSTGKLDKILETITDKDRCHDSTMFGGADTGRWAGRLIQMHNFPRGSGLEMEEIEEILDITKTQRPEEAAKTLAVLYGGVSLAARECLRALVRAEAGKTLLVADFSQIEARIVNWLAGQDDALEAFRAYDEKRGPDVYRLVASRFYGIEIGAVKSYHRQMGKAIELGCGFGMGKDKFQDTAKAQYRLDLTLEQAEEGVNFYRRTHPNVVSLWYDVQDAVIACIENPTAVTQVGKLKIGRDPRFAKATGLSAPLCVVLPSGRRLYYQNPHLLPPKAGFQKPEIGFWGVEKGTKRWGQLRTYGAKLVENATQAIAYDLEANSMEAAESAGFPPILTVHDETGAEANAATAQTDLDKFCQLVKQTPPWAKGLPVEAKGFTTTRYRKD